MGILDDHSLTDGRLSISEKDTIPVPYLEAYKIVGQHLQRAQRWRAKMKRKGN
jgi:hypothetical protein